MGALINSAYLSKKTQILEEYSIPPSVLFIITLISSQPQKKFFKYFYLVTTSPISLSLLLPICLLISFLLAFSASSELIFVLSWNLS